ATLGRESGELQYSAYALANLVFLHWFTGAPLSAVIAEADAALTFYGSIGDPAGQRYVQPFKQAARCLMGLTKGPTSFDDDEFDEAGFLAAAQDNGLAMATFHLLQLEVCCLLGEPARAVDLARRAEPWLVHLRTLCLQADFSLFAGLALCALHDGT